MLVVLKLPIVYLCGVVWWAIRAEPRPLEGAGWVVQPVGAPPSLDRPPLRARRPRGSRPGPHGMPVRSYARGRHPARAGVEP